MEKIIKKFIIVLLVLLVIMISLIGFIKRKSRTIINYNVEEIHEYLSDKMFPQNLYSFRKDYNGNLEFNDIYTELNKIAQCLSYIATECDSYDKYVNYYSKNKDEICKILGEYNEEDFIKLCDTFIEKGIKYTGAEVEYCIYQENSMKKENNKWKCNMTFVFGKENKIDFTLYIANNKNKEERSTCIETFLK